MQVDNGHGCRGATPASATGGHRRLQVGLALRLVRIAARARGGAKLQWRAFLDDTTKRLLQSLVGTIADREGDAGEGSQRWGLGRAPLHALGRKEIDHPERHCTFVEGWMVGWSVEGSGALCLAGTIRARSSTTTPQRAAIDRRAWMEKLRNVLVARARTSSCDVVVEGTPGHARTPARTHQHPGQSDLPTPSLAAAAHRRTSQRPVASEFSFLWGGERGRGWVRRESNSTRSPAMVASIGLPRVPSGILVPDGPVVSEACQWPASLLLEPRCFCERQASATPRGRACGQEASMASRAPSSPPRPPLPPSPSTCAGSNVTLTSLLP